MKEEYNPKQYKREQLIKGTAKLISHELEYGEPNAPWFMELNIDVDLIAHFLEQYDDDFIQFIFNSEMKKHFRKYFVDYEAGKGVDYGTSETN